MLLKVGQLAKKVCLSVRTLHHYDDIGLLSPSVRSEAGHRLYNTSDISRLHRIQALKQLGISLQKVAGLLQDHSTQLPDIIAQQIVSLDQEIEQAVQLKTKLQLLQRNLHAGHKPDMSNWLDTLALMNIYEKYLTPEEIEAINHYAIAARQELEQDWPDMVKQLQHFVDQKIPPGNMEVRTFIIRWTEMLERLTGHNPNLLLKVYAMSRNEIAMQVQRGITPLMTEYLVDAMGQLHRHIFTQYLSPEQMQQLDKNRQRHPDAWPPLIETLREKMNRGVSSTSDEVKPLARQWKTLYESSVTGGDPDITERLRLAYEREPLLTQGTGLDQALFQFIRQAIMSL
jgi:MerR family transcriptional regulator, thiopeptide resistance regulator